MRILQIVHLFPPEQSAGTELYAQALSRTLLARGHDCFVLAGSNQIASAPGLLIGEHDGLTVARLVGLRKRSGRRADIYDSTVEHLVRKCLALWRPNVVHLQHWSELTGNLVGICAELGIPSVVTLHDQWIACSRIHRIQPDGTFCSERETPCVSCVDRDPWQTDEEVARELGCRQQLIEQELRSADCILVPSKSQQQFLRQITNFPLDRLKVVPLGSPFDGPRKTPQHMQRPSEAPVRIGYWGYLAPLKGPHLLLEAARLLPEQARTRVEWHLLGRPTDPAYYARLKELAEGLPVIFHGPYRQRDLDALGLDVAVFPSLCHETYSFVLDEAFRMGIPAIVPDRGAPAERIGQAGTTFAAGDAEDLARKIRLLLEEPDILEGLRRAVPEGEAVSMATHAAALEKVYQETAQSTSGKEETPQPYRSLLEHREQQLFDRDQALCDRDKLVEDLSRQVTRLTEELHAQQAKFQEQIEAGLLLNSMVIERDQLLVAVRAELKAEMEEQNRLLAAVGAELDARTQEASALHAQVVERDLRLAAAQQSMLGRLDSALKRLLDDRLSPKDWLAARVEQVKGSLKRSLPFPVRHRLRQLQAWIFSWDEPPHRSSEQATPWLLSGASQDEAYLEHLLALKRPRPEHPDSETHRRMVESAIGSSQFNRLVIYPPTILWNEHLFQRPQQIFRSLASQGALCFYCSANPALDRVDGIRAIGTNLYLCSDPSLLIEPSKHHDAVFWATRPDHRAYLDLFPTARLVYEVIDELEVFPLACDAMEQDHIRLLMEADVVVATAVTLHAKAQRIRPDAVLAPNGVRIEDFQIEPEAKPPPDLARIVRRGRPIVGYYGALADWFDYELVAFAAERCPHLSFVLIGPDYDRTTGRLPQGQNVFWLGPKRYDELPRYLQWFDVATIPFKVNRITKATSPIKLFEYMAAGKPIVTTALPECQRYKSVLVAETPEGFTVALAEALDRRHDPSYLDTLREEAAANSWEGRVDAILSALRDTESTPLRRMARPQPDDASGAHAATETGDRQVSLDADWGSANGPDILCFPINPWGFRFQRTGQFLRRFAQAGHRVFHIEIGEPEAGPERHRASPRVSVLEPNLHQVTLELGRGLNLYQKAFSQDIVESLLWNLDQLRQREMIGDAICLVAFPGWAPLAERLREEFCYKIVYDCMDHHRGFGNIAEPILALEGKLTASADLMLVSSMVLYQELSARNPNTVLVRNAADFDHFHGQADAGVLRGIPKPIIGYYGAISSWFDVEWVEEAARRRPDWSFVLIGHTFGADLGELVRLPNVHLLGEQRYESLPGYLAAFDVCCIPFRLNDLTRATDPVKFYEYLCAGKPIVSARLPELAEYADCIYFASDADEFVDAIAQGLAERDDRLASRRIELGRRNGWDARWSDLSRAIETIHPGVSVIIVNYNTLVQTRQCLESLLRHTGYPHYEIIVVDNGS
ncbi:MAG TPA: glycosyltransferase, partial [Candidatus Methylomirabilis sp.]|nr:glycosyltransferase [Candidatus Methylomirabilis sp.]